MSGDSAACLFVGFALGCLVTGWGFAMKLKNSCWHPFHQLPMYSGRKGGWHYWYCEHCKHTWTAPELEYADGPGKVGKP